MPRLIFDEAALLNRPKPPLLVDDLLVSGSLAMLVSEPGLGKSFVAKDLALSVAAGQPSFLGLPLRVQGPVVYVLGEGAGRFGLRIRAWKQHYNIARPLPFHWTDGPLDLLNQDTVDRFTDEVAALRPALVVVDTLSRCLVGADENSQAAMTEAVQSLDSIRTSVPGLTVLLLHHTNASGSRERGSTVFKGAVDAQFKLRVPQKKNKDDAADDAEEPARGELLDLIVVKQKDLDERAPLRLRKTLITLAGEVEANGQPSTGLVWSRVYSGRVSPGDLLACIQGHPQGLSKSAVFRITGGNKGKVFDQIDEFAAQGLVRIQAAGREHMVYPLLPA